ncbi:MAG: lipid-transfer protein [Chloroflexi bacterium]|nr:lipid-transfer protein [Chloroflexota bacterium]
MIENIRDKTAIVGIGVVDFSTNMGRTEWYTASQSIKLAAEDAGLKLEEIDALVKNKDDGPDPSYMQKGLGIDNLLYHSETKYGASAMLDAVLAVASGAANYAVYYQTAHRASGPPKSLSEYRVARELKDDMLDLVRYDFYSPFGLIDPPGFVAMNARRYMYAYRTSPQEWGWVPVVLSENAARNRKSVFCKKPVTLNDYLISKMVVDPIRQMDCAPKVDGAVAIIVTTAERAKKLKQKPAIISSVAMGAAPEGQMHTSYGRKNIAELPEMANMAKELFRVAGVKPKHIKAAILDDAFIPYVPMQLEALGFCKKGEGAAFCAGGDRIRVGGDLPLNTSGGAMAEGKFDTARIIEAVRQIRGTSPNQVKNADFVLATSGAGGPADGLILRRS